MQFFYMLGWVRHSSVMTSFFCRISVLAIYLCYEGIQGALPDFLTRLLIVSDYLLHNYYLLKYCQIRALGSILPWWSMHN